MVWECIQSVLKTGLLALTGSKVLQTGLQSAEPSRRLKFGFNPRRSRVSDQPYMATSRTFEASSNIRVFFHPCSHYPHAARLHVLLLSLIQGVPDHYRCFGLP